MPDYLRTLVQQNWPPSFGPLPADWHWLLQTNGAQAAHNNLLLFGIPAPHTQPSLVAKICRASRHSHTLRTEYTRLSQFWRALGAHAAGRAPQPLALGQHGADLVLLMSYCPGSPLLTAPSHFWQNRQQVEMLLLQAAAWLRQLHQGAARPDDVTDATADFNRKAAAFADLFALASAERDELAHLTRQVAQAQAEAAGCTLLQGDFWPGNVLLPVTASDAHDAATTYPPTRPTTRPMTLVDWQFSRWDRHTSLDVYLFITVCAVKTAVYTPSYAERAQRAAQVLLSWRDDLLPAYLAAYGQPTPCRLLPPRAGLLAGCVELAARPYLAFGLMQPDAVQWHTLFTEIRRLWSPES